MSAAKAKLAQAIETCTARIGVFGMGYVGLPLALTFAEGGFRATGFDIDATKVDAILSGRSYIEHIDDARVAKQVAAGKLDATRDLERLGEMDAILICVPTPLTPQREPEMRYVVETTEAIATHLRPAQLIVLESTTWPGTTEELVRPTLEATGLVADHDFFLAFSPEREDPGNADFDTQKIPKVVGGVGPASGDLAEQLYGAVMARTVRVSSAATAEATKLTENIFRAVNIALANELKVTYDRMGIDIWEVLDAAETKPFGFMRFNPGPGWGGHCIPLDPFYLSWKARESGVAPKFIELAGEVNLAMPSYVVSKLRDALNERGQVMKGAQILLLGVAYKCDVDDCRESPAFEIWDRLERLGADVRFHDPHVPNLPKTRRRPRIAGQPSQDLDAETLAAADAVVVVTDHAAVDYALVSRHARLIVDTRGVFRDANINVVRS